ncbi:MAG: tetratricopeptide repeat protein [Alphaproteobacteria bacterium]|nr:tetratricopeptide repeat protein [Alphaproteobacteria bacterium]
MMISAFTKNKAFLLVSLLTLLVAAACAPTVDLADDEGSPAFGMNLMAAKMQERGDTLAALDFYRRALQRDPNNAVAIRGMAAMLEQRGDHKGAAAQYVSAVQARPRDGELRRGYGKVLIALDRPAEAKDQYEAALDINNDDAKARNGLAIAKDYLGDHAGAQKEYLKVLAEDGGNLATRNNLAYSYILTHNYREAIQILEPHVKNPSATPALRQNLALAYGLAGMDVDAERVAKMDLPAAKVKENLAYYKRQRAELAVSTAPYAEVGTYATEALAAAQVGKLKKQMDSAGAELKPVIVPEVATPGGTPRFTVRMMGCAKPDDVQVFCKELAKNGLPCEARGK